jgi:hypothetical protein
MISESQERVEGDPQDLWMKDEGNRDASNGDVRTGNQLLIPRSE